MEELGFLSNCPPPPAWLPLSSAQRPRVTGCKRLLAGAEECGKERGSRLTGDVRHPSADKHRQLARNTQVLGGLHALKRYFSPRLYVITRLCGFDSVQKEMCCSRHSRACLSSLSVFSVLFTPSVKFELVSSLLNTPPLSKNTKL